MSNNMKRIESMLFNSETAHATDFRGGKITPCIKTVYEEKKPSCQMVRPPPLKEIATLTDWKSPHVPFNLFGQPKYIIETDPRTIQKPYNKPEDNEREAIRKTRPRFVTTAMGSLDDFPDECRQFIIDDVYKSTTHQELSKTVELADRGVHHVKSPLPLKSAPPKPIKLKNLVAPYISPEWRWESASWDSKQMQKYCDANREFWQDRIANRK